MTQIFEALFSLNFISHYSAQRTFQLLESVSRDVNNQILLVLKSINVMSIKDSEF